MKLSTAILFASASVASAFAPSNMFASRGQALFAGSEVEEAIQAAKEASEKFGKTSPEAAAAWDVVEEIDAASSHLKTSSAPVVEESASAPKKEFNLSPEYSAALEDAKRVTEEKGIQSSEARLAWELVEELGATQSHHQNSGSG
mmetsp:Transcript_68258/g.102948  ORF Transcript_68258/g.102948 Transcript_68258/m.102948 type:complete len:145 (-) Transcript_68258:219-653(-)